MEMGFSRERFAFSLSLAWQDVQACRIPRCQPSSNYNLVLQDGDFSIANVHRAHGAVGPSRQLVMMSDGNVTTWTTD